MARGLVQTGVAFLVLLVAAVLANHLLIAKQTYDTGAVANVFIDNVYNAMVDTKRIIALDNNNVLSDSVSDAARGQGCAKLDDTLLYSDKFKAYAKQALTEINALLVNKSLQVKQVVYYIDVDYSGTETTCVVDINLNYTFTVGSTDGGIIKTENLLSKKTLSYDDDTGAYTVKDGTRTDFSS